MNTNRLNEYANSMFRFEYLHEGWLSRCTDYIHYLFGNQILGKTVVDYAFGRGNWALAFKRAGAARVLAVDAAYDNVLRFDNYCRQNGIDGIEIIHGNILEAPLNLQADVYWVYGILPCISDVSSFLNPMISQANPGALLYIYSYNANSLREFTVQSCRKIIVYPTENDFAEDSPLFVRAARMRARDDLTAPFVRFETAHSLSDLLRTCGIYVMRQDMDFQEFLHGTRTEDFYPHQFLCSLRPETEQPIQEPLVPYAQEADVLRSLVQAVLALPLSERERQNIAIGLFNTHFAYLDNGVKAGQSVVELFLFLAYILLRKDAASLSASTDAYLSLLKLALAAAPREQRESITASLEPNFITTYLVNNNIRL